MNLGTIWSNYNSINVRNTKKKNLKQNQNVFHNIFNPKKKNNKVNKSIILNKNINPGLTNFKKNYKDSKAYWGTPTWYLFHSIAAKINETYYKENYNIIWSFIKQTCSILPCPYCRYHAVNYVGKIKVTQINTKEKLINIIFEFHNSVNKRNKQKLFLKSQLEKYKKADINKIFELFKSRFFKSYYSTREFQDWTKSKYKVTLLEFINNTKNHYN